MKIVCGIDEAGRGAVIGPLVLAGVIVDEIDEEKLRNINVKDSKLLSRKQREDLFGKILSISKGHKIFIICPAEIDNAVNRNDNLNLNWLEAGHSAAIINELAPEKAIVDCPTINTRNYKNYLIEKIQNKNIELNAEHKADYNYPVVSAASILAKVTRDNEIDKIKKSLNVDFGSGYPSDPMTVAFLENNLQKYPEIFRKTWSTVRMFEEKKVQRKLGEY